MKIDFFDAQNCQLRLFLLLLLCTAAALLMTPVLLHPHWGMFSDRLQIVDCCEHLSSTTGITSWFNDSLTDLRPAVHWPDYLTWWLAPNDPRGFFVVRTVTFISAVGFTYLNCLYLSRSPIVSFCASLFWFLSLPTYEVAYTLDKGEIFVASLFAIVLWLDLSQRQSEIANSGTTRKIQSRIALIAVAASYAMFSKQTGQLLLCYSTASFLFTFAQQSLFNHLQQSWQKNGLIRWSAFVFLITSLSWTTYEFFYIGHGGLTHHRYKEMNYTLPFVIQHVSLYLTAMPEIGVMIFAAALVLVTGFIQRKNNGNTIEFLPYCSPAALLATVIIGAAGVSAWKGNIVYGWFPLLSFLIPSFAFALRCLDFKFKRMAALLTCVALATFVPARFFDAQLQFQLDALFDELASRCVQVPEAVNRTFILPFDDPSSFEVGNMLRLAIKSKNKSSKSIEVANMVKATGLTTASLPGFTNGPGLQKCFLDQASQWSCKPIIAGDVLIVPSGTLPAKISDYRGVPMFYKTWESWCGWLEQLDLKPIFTVSKRIRRIGSKPQEMKWVGLEVTKSPDLSIETADGGWLFDGAELAVNKSLCGLIVTIKSRNSHRLQSLRVTDVSGTSLIQARNVGDTSFWDIPLISTREKITAPVAHEKPLFLIKGIDLHY